ncbi:serine hydrolase domain-containing protein [Paenibacillus sp. NPDC056722]|uniref:serine hydrolase domain-containing protein n=1 Tax=Paenibacillus sp. NPDC056722 TaxID=3345924 RepID=UPI00369F29BF
MTLENYFPKILDKQVDTRKKDITIEHLLQMSVGLDWPEFGEWNYMPSMFVHDIVKFVLDRPLVDEPGSRMNYNSGCSHVLSAIITKATGMKTSAFAERYLLGPLGIEDYSGLRMQKASVMAQMVFGCSRMIWARLVSCICRKECGRESRLYLQSGLRSQRSPAF